MRPLSLVSFGCLGPHLADILEHHVHVSVEGLNLTQNLASVATVDQYLRVSLHCLRKQREWSLVKCVFLWHMLLFLSHYNSTLLL